MKSLDGRALFFGGLVIKHRVGDAGKTPVCGGRILLVWAVMCC